MLPNPLIARRYFARGAYLWLLARLLGSLAVAMSGENPIHLTFAASVLIVAVSVVLGAVEMHRRQERALLENLAVSRAMRVAFFAIPALLGEGSIAFAVNLAG